MARKDAYITLKDHKETFATKLPCRLINPAKSEMGRVSKSILGRITQNVRGELEISAWKNTSAVVDWFQKIEKKEECTYVAIFEVNRNRNVVRLFDGLLV